MSDDTPNTTATQMTIGEILSVKGWKPNSTRQAFGKAGFTNWDVRRAPSAQEALWLNEYSPKRKVAAGGTPSKPQPVQEAPQKKAAKTPAPRIPRISIPGAYDLIIWSEIGLGFYSITNMFGLIGGGIAAGVMTIFFEKARKVAGMSMRTVDRADFDTDHRYNAAYNAAAQHNDALRIYKHLHYTGAILIGCAFCWANGNALYAHTAQYADFATQRVHDTLTYADATARGMALFLTGLAIASLRAITISREI